MKRRISRRSFLFLDEVRLRNFILDKLEILCYTLVTIKERKNKRMYIVRPVGANLVWSKKEKEHLKQASEVLKSCFQLMEHYNYNKFCISEDEKIGRYDFMKLMHLFCRIANSSITLEANNDE